MTQVSASLFLRSEHRAGEGGGRLQGRRLADSTSSAGARAVLKRPSRQSPGPAGVGTVPRGLGGAQAGRSQGLERSAVPYMPHLRVQVSILLPEQGSSNN